MRTIKFRGKRVDTGKWIYGDLLTFNRTECEISDWNTVDYSRVDVIPETVGQFTGYFDENKQEIYEDDIIRCVTSDGEEYVSAVRHDGGAFAIDVNCCDYDYSAIGWAIDVDVEEMRVIGNIHDNPELLEGGEE